MHACPVMFNSLRPQVSPVAHQAHLSMEFSRQEYWNGLPFPSPLDLPDPRIKPTSLVSHALAGRFLTTTLSGHIRVSLYPQGTEYLQNKKFLCVFSPVNATPDQRHDWTDFSRKHLHAYVLSCFSHVSLWHYGLSPAQPLCPWDSSGKNTEVGCHDLLQGIFPTQGFYVSYVFCIGKQVLYY